MADASVVIKVALDTTEIEKGLDSLKKDIKKSAEELGKAMEDSAKNSSMCIKTFSGEIEENNKKIEELAEKSSSNTEKYWTGAASKIRSVISSTTKVAANGLIDGMEASIRAGSSFEAGMSEVKAISGASEEEFQRLTEKAKEMGMTTKFSAIESAEALKHMSMAGWDAQQMTSGLAGVMNLAAVSGEDFGTVSGIVADSMKAFGLNAKESTHFADVLAKASSSSKANITMMGEAFKYVAPVAGSMKYSIEDTATVIGLMAKAGINGEEAGTALCSIFTRLAEPSKEAARALDDLGISAQNSDGTMKPLREVLGDLRNKFSGLDDSQKEQYAASIAGQEAMSGLLAIINTSDKDFNSLTKSIDNSKDAAKKQADTMNDNLKGAFWELGSAAEAVGIEIYDDIKEPLKKIVKEGAGYVRGLASAIQKNGIKSIVPEETIDAVRNLGSIAKTVGGGGIKVLVQGIKGLAENIDIVVPAATGLLTVFKGYKTVKTVASAIGTARDAVSGFKTAADVAGAMTQTKNAVSGMTVAVGALSGGMGKATAVSGILKAGVTALGGPIGVAVAAIGALAAGLGAYALISGKAASGEKTFADKVKESAEKQKEYLKAIEKNKKEREESIEAVQTEGKQADFLSMKLEDLMSVENKSTGQKEQIKTIVEKLNELLPDLGLAYDEEKDKLNQSTDAIKKNIQAQKEMVRAKAYGSQVDGIVEDIIKTEDKLAKSTEQRSKAEDKLAKAKEELDSKAQHGDKFAVKEITELNEAYKSADEQVKKYQKSLTELNTELETAENRQIGGENYAEFLGNIDKICEEAKVKAEEIPPSIEKGIKEGLYANPMTGEELNTLLNLDGLVQEALSEGKEVTVAVIQGIQSGKYMLPESTAALEDLVKFDNMIQKAGVQGEKVPTELANKIAQGKMTIDEAIKEMCDSRGLTPKQFGITNVLDETAQETKKSSDEIQKNIQVKPTDNSQAAKKSESSFSNVFGKGSGKVKKNSSEMSKSAEIKAQDNSGSADKTINTFADNLEKGDGKVKAASGKLEKASTDGFGEKTSEAKKAGEKLGESFVTGISSKVNNSKKAGKKMASSGKSGVNEERSGFVTAGKYLSSGIASGITINSGVVASAARKVIKKAKNAANDEADTNSPSRVFRDEVGKFLPLGMAAGIEENTGAVETASRDMAQASLKAATDELDIHSPSKKFKEVVGKNIPKGIAAGIKVAQDELIAEMEDTMSKVLSTAQSMAREGEYTQIGSEIMSGLSKSLSTAKTRSSDSLHDSINKQYEALTTAHAKEEEDIQKKIDKEAEKKKKELQDKSKKEEDKLQKKINKTKSKKKKKQYRKELSKLKTENKKEEKALQKEISKDTKKKNKKLSKLKSANRKEESQLQDAGEKVANAFNTAFEKESDRLTQIAQKQIQDLSEEYQKEYNRIAGLRDNLASKQQSWGNIYDLKQNIFDIERYQKHLKDLENKIPESMMEKILGMNVDEASAYMEWFQTMSADQQKAYIENWNKQQSMSEIFSNNFFADDFEKIESEYQTKLKKATDDLQMQIKQAGVNIAKGLTAGITSETRNASKAMKNLCNDLIKAAKKKLKIKSPSREFAEIGRYNVLGVEEGHEKEAKKLYRQMEDVSETMVQRFAKARLNIPELQARMQSAVQKQMGRVTADVQMPQVPKNIVPSKETERIIYMGPEKIEVVSVLEGREVARSTAPYMDQFLNDTINRRLRGGT